MATIRSKASAKKLGDKVDPSPETRHLQSEVERLTKVLAERKRAEGEIALALADMKDCIVAASPVEMQYSPKKSAVESPCAMVAHATDWHIGQATRSEAIEEFGEYSYDIACKRVNHWMEQLIKKATVQRGAYSIDELVILHTGDLISGSIHPELLMTAEFPVPVQAVRAGYLLGGFIAGLAPHFKKVRVELITLDNHGRLTVKPQKEDGGLNNWGYVVGVIAQQHTAGLKNVDVNLHPMSSKVIAVSNEQYLCFHGHEIKGWSGRPWYGFGRRLEKEAVARMNMSPDLHFTKMVFGHWHVANNDQHWSVGGSLSGTDSNDHSQGRHSPPHQTSWFVHPKYGEFDWTRWWL